jgi:hypothetical protein
MKKLFLTILLVLSITVMLHAQEYYEGGSGGAPTSGFDWDIRFGISFPIISNYRLFSDGDRDDIRLLSVGAGALSSLIFSSLSTGVAFQYTVVPRLLAPGIYADIHFNLPSWFLVGMFTDWEQKFLLLQPGVRLYNQFQFTRTFGVEPFLGINYIYISMTDTFRQFIPLINAGFVLKMGSTFGFEYAFNRSNRDNKDGWTPTIHRIGFTWSLRDR